MEKQEIRSKMKELKSRLPKLFIQRNSDSISNHLLQTTAYNQCNILFSYVSFNQEVITTTILKTALSQKKKVAVPKITGNEMKFYCIETLADLKPGTLGILEPTTTIEVIPNIDAHNLVLVPGLAFDLKKNRIGYGKGYYDSYFIKHKGIPMIKIALAYDFQVLNELPVEEHDIKVDQILTQTRIIE